MSHLVMPKVTTVETQDNYGRFVAEPLEKGFGVTLGNALRRVLLGYLPGAAVTRIRIEGIQHEFSSIPHVKEDTMEFLLNVKALRLKPVSGQPGKLTLEASGEGRVSAADIKPSADFEIVNPELHLATLDAEGAKLSVEFDVELGKGYKEAETGENNFPAGTIGVDAVFTPVHKVNYTTESVSIGRETSHERLIMEVWTDGTISPLEALGQSAKLLTEQLAPFAEQLLPVPEKAGEIPSHPSIPDEQYNMPVDQLDLSVRTRNCLRHAGITTVGEILERGEDELMTIRNFGQKSRQEIIDRLAGLGLTLTPGGLKAGAEPEKVESEKKE
ncbi:MAG: DNA-directed RNA polymerase subunit alpha [Chloroflexota bacterium]